MTTIIERPDRRKMAMMVIKHRLALEIRFPGMAESQSGRFTMQSVKGWGFTGRTRKQAHKWVIEQLEPTLRWEACVDCTTDEETRPCPVCTDPVCENCATTKDLDHRHGCR